MKRIKRVVQRRRSASTGPEPVVTLSVPETDLRALATDLGLPPTKSGLLLKYTNVVKRWKTRFFTLENGVLIYSAPTGDDIDDNHPASSADDPSRSHHLNHHHAPYQSESQHNHHQQIQQQQHQHQQQQQQQQQHTPTSAANAPTLALPAPNTPTATTPTSASVASSATAIHAAGAAVSSAPVASPSAASANGPASAAQSLDLLPDRERSSRPPPVSTNTNNPANHITSATSHAPATHAANAHSSNHHQHHHHASSTTAAAAAARRKSKKKRILRRATSKDDKDRDIKGQINLQFAVVSADDSDPSRFAIDVGNDVYHCKADTPEERDEWVDVLQQSIDYFRGLIERAVERAKETTAANSPMNMKQDAQKQQPHEQLQLQQQQQQKEMQLQQQNQQKQQLHQHAQQKLSLQQHQQQRDQQSSPLAGSSPQQTTPSTASPHGGASASNNNVLAIGQVSEESEESILEDDGLKEAEQSRKALLSELRRVLTLWREQWISSNSTLTDTHILQTLAQTFPELASEPPSPHTAASTQSSREIAKGLIDLVTWCAHILQTNDQMFDRRLNADITRLMGNGLPVFPTSPEQRLAPVLSMPESEFPLNDSDSDDEFVDALSRAASKRSSFAHQLGLTEAPDESPTSITSAQRVPSRKSGSIVADSVNKTSPNRIRRISTSQLSKTAPQPRTHLPKLANNSREKLNIFGILKDSVGKDLSKITLPVGLNEPLSFVQRLAEDIEYSELLDIGAAESDPNRRMMYVAAMVISHYSSTQGRVGKPFNPLLGETACLVRPNKGKGVRFISEQVSHHPPISACYAEGSGGSWKYYNAIEVKNKFWGKSLEVFPTGLNHIEFPEHGDHYVLEQVTACVHNIVVGRMWLDNYGEMVIENRTNGGKCVINFAKTGWMSDASSFAAIKGTVYDANGKAKIKIGGNWTKSVYEELGRNKRKVIWQVDERPPEGASQSYNMTKWAISLNGEVTEEERKMLPPSDSRLRPDQRALERGQNDLGSRIKQALEEGQRTRRREMEEAGQKWEPRWFTEVTDEVTGQRDYRFNGKFFEQQAVGEWPMCVDIFACAAGVEP